jgi:hypothetical protein
MASKRRRRVPETKPKFDSYQRDSAKHLASGTPPRGEELGLSADELNEWTSFGDVWVMLYPLYTNRNTRTASVVDDVNGHIDAFAKFTRPLLNRISGSAFLNHKDLNVLNITPREKSISRRGKIDDKPMVAFSVIGGGQMKVQVRTTTEAARARMHPLSDLIECRYFIRESNSAGPATMLNPAQAPSFLISKKAMFEIDFGTDNLGKYLVAFFRWLNTTKPANNGPWTLPVIGLIG